MKIFGSVTFSFCLLLFFSGCSKIASHTNSGHRAGGDLSTFPENSILALEESCCGGSGKTPLQQRRDFVYLEFDVRETVDHELVVFHDSSLRRMIQGGQKKTKVRNLGLDEIKDFHFKGMEQETIPTLREFIQASIDFKLQKPMVIEIKNIYSVKGMENLLDIVEYYKVSYADSVDIIYEKNFDFPKSPVTLMCFKWNLPKLIQEDPVFWKNRLKSTGLEGIFQTRVHRKRFL